MQWKTSEVYIIPFSFNSARHNSLNNILFRSTVRMLVSNCKHMQWNRHEVYTVPINMTLARNNIKNIDSTSPMRRNTNVPTTLSNLSVQHTSSSHKITTDVIEDIWGMYHTSDINRARSNIFQWQHNNTCNGRHRRSINNLSPSNVHVTAASPMLPPIECVAPPTYLQHIVICRCRRYVTPLRYLSPSTLHVTTLFSTTGMCQQIYAFTF